jgi:hypothetical protein
MTKITVWFPAPRVEQLAMVKNLGAILHGKVVYFVIQIENEGMKYPWGSMISTLIPCKHGNKCLGWRGRL